MCGKDGTVLSRAVAKFLNLFPFFASSERVLIASIIASINIEN